MASKRQASRPKPETPEEGIRRCTDFLVLCPDDPDALCGMLLDSFHHGESAAHSA